MMRIFLFTLFCTLFCSQSAFAIGLMETSARQAYIIDYETGQVLFSKNPNERMPTSSMSKVMTMYMVFEALKSGKITKDTEFVVSEKAWRMGGSKMFIEVGKKVRVEDLIRGVIIQSGNDATIALAEGLAGSEEAFAIAMTRRAKSLGLANSNFVNASGWPDENHYSTARDLALLARLLVSNFPEYYNYYSEREYEYNDIKQFNRNPLLKRNLNADGVKTGYTEAAGYGLIGSGVVDGRRTIMVLNGMQSAKEREEESARLFSWAVSGFENVRVYTKGDVVENAPVDFGDSLSVPLIVDNDVYITIPRLSRDQIKAEAIYTKPFVAPVKAGEPVGKLKISIPGQDPLDYTLITANGVAELGFFAKTMEKAKRSIGDLLKKE